MGNWPLWANTCSCCRSESANWTSKQIHGCEGSDKSNQWGMQQPASICAVKADVNPDLRLGPTGWNLDERNCGVGRHHASCFQDPTLVRPQMSGNLARTTLLREHGEWYVLELCEPLEGLIDLGADVFGYDGPRDLLTIITEGEKDPVLMGFKFQGEEPPLFPDPERRDAADDILQAPEDEVLGLEIDGGEIQGGADVPMQGRLVVTPSPVDMVVVNGVELSESSSLRALRAGLTHYGLSTSGSKSSKVKCFARLLDHQKALELQVVHAAAERAQQELTRTPNAVKLETRPSCAEQQQLLTHLPYAPRCSSCVCFRARSDKHERSGASRRSSTPCISFDFAYTKSAPQDADSKEISMVTSLVMTDGASGYIHVTPLCSKNQWSLMVQNLDVTMSRPYCNCKGMWSMHVCRWVCQLSRQRHHHIPIQMDLWGMLWAA